MGQFILRACDLVGPTQAFVLVDVLRLRLSQCPVLLAQRRSISQVDAVATVGIHDVPTFLLGIVGAEEDLAAV